MNSKLKKHLKKEADKVFCEFLGEGELEETKKDVERISNHFNNSTLETIRDNKRMLNVFFERVKSNNLNTSPL